MNSHLRLTAFILLFCAQSLAGEGDANQTATTQIKLGKPVFSYDFNRPESLKIGDLHFATTDLYSELHTIALKYKGRIHYKYEDYLLLHWPTDLVEHGTITLERGTGQIIYQTSTGKGQISKWQAKAKKITKGQRIGEGSSNASKSTQKPKRLAKATFGIAMKKVGITRKALESPFRYCIIRTFEEDSVRLCSPFFKLVSKHKIKRIVRPQRELAIVKINNRKTLLSKVLPMTTQPLSFFAQTTSGVELAIKATPKLFELKKASLLEDQDLIEVIGIGNKPRQAKLLEDSNPGFLDKLKWGSLSAEETHWRLTIPSTNTNLNVSYIGADTLVRDVILAEPPASDE